MLHRRRKARRQQQQQNAGDDHAAAAAEPLTKKSEDAYPVAPGTAGGYYQQRSPVEAGGEEIPAELDHNSASLVGPDADAGVGASRRGSVHELPT